MLRYNRPARNWSEANPIGNGRLGAMIYGRTSTEILLLNENSVWYGGAQSRLSPDALNNLTPLRAHIRAGNHAEAERLVRLGLFTTPSSQRHYEPLGKCVIEFGHDEDEVSCYQRTLDLENACSRIQYEYRGISYKREMFASFPHDVMVMRITASRKTEFTIKLTRTSENEYETNEFLDSIRTSASERGCMMVIMHATPGGNGSNKLCCVIGAWCDDENDNGDAVQAIGNKLVINARAATVVIAAQTTFRYADPEQAAIADINNALHKPSDLWHSHVEDYQRLYRRVELRLKSPSNNASKSREGMPTDQRLKVLRENPDSQDPELVILYFNFGRYLLISCSRCFDDRYSGRPLSLPATLQGLWNPSFQPAWGSKYTININLQMNYWPVLPCNLAPECETPLFDLLERMAVNGRKTAQGMYGCRGWCAHHNTDIWADTDPQDCWMPATIWPLGGAWLCMHVWESYLFRGGFVGSNSGGVPDKESKQWLTRMWPILKGCVQFLVEFLIPDSTGQYRITNPSLSPENSFVDSETGQVGVLCEGSTIDTQIVSAVLSAFLHIYDQESTLIRDIEAMPLPPLDPASERRDIYGRNNGPLRPDDSLTDLVTIAKDSLARLPPTAISPSLGTIQEWGFFHDYIEHEPGHRHTSHLWALHPGSAITPRSTPNLAQAAAATLKRREEHGGGHTGWSRAWLVNMHARLQGTACSRIEPGNKEQERVGLGDDCAKHLRLLLSQSTMDNLLDVHPPFQIDGNFGGASGILEMCVQSHEVVAINGTEILESRAHSNPTEENVPLIRLLPAWPKKWRVLGGLVRGVRARGGFEVNFSWEEKSGKLVEPVILRSVVEGVRKAVLCFPPDVMQPEKAETEANRMVIVNFEGLQEQKVYCLHANNG